jgi:hypothetical protein
MPKRRDADGTGDGRSAPEREDRDVRDAAKGTLARVADSVVDTASEVVSQAGTVAGTVAGRVLKGSRETQLRRLNRVPIANLYDIHPEAMTASRRDLGSMTIPVLKVRGTAVQGAPQRGSDFTPLPALKGANWRQRWQRLRAAQDRLAILPPIDVLQTEDGYWVLDGHNRVALALLAGQDDIDANVTHVHLPGTSDASLPTGNLASLLSDSLEVRGAARAGTARADEAAAAARREAESEGHEQA